MTSDHLLSALSIATLFNLHLQGYPHMGGTITDCRLVSVGSPVRRSGADYNIVAVALHIAPFRGVPLHFTCGAAQELI